MKIELPQEKLEAIVAEAVEKGITKGVGDWEVQNEICDAGTAALKKADLPSLVSGHLQRIMADRADIIALEVAKAIVTGLEMGAEGIAINLTTRMLVGLSRPDEYETDERRKRREKAIADQVRAQFKQQTEEE